MFPKKLTDYSVIFLFVLPVACSQGPGHEILAAVGPEKIRVSDLQNLFRREGGIYGEEIVASPEGARIIKRRMLNTLVEESLLLQEAERRGIQTTAEDDKSFKDLLGDRSPDATWLDRQLKKRKIERLIDQEIGAKTDATPQEVRTYYQAHRREFREPDRVRCRQMTVAKKEKAEMILSLLKKGENFAALAQKYSESPDRDQGGDLGFIGRGESPRVFEEACFTLSTGQASEVVSSEYGFHIIKVTEKKPGRDRSLKEATPEIMGALKETRRQEGLRVWLESLHKGTKITIDEEVLERVSLGS